MATSPETERVRKLRAIFDCADFAWLVDRLVARMAAGRPMQGTVVRAAATAGERRALDDLLGRKSTSGAQLYLSLEILEHTLRHAGLLDRLEELVLACRGPVENRRIADEQLRGQWRQLFDLARDRLEGRPALQEWLNELAGYGILKRLARGEMPAAQRLLEKACVILTRKPEDEILLANLGAEVAEDSHALDRGQPLATLCLRAVAREHGIDGQSSADMRRDAWAAIGVLIDDLSAPALVFNLHAAGGSALESILRCHREQVQPAFLTYRQISRGGDFLPLPDESRIVHICENPAVVSAAASELGARCRPLICTNGQPVSSVRLLLRKLQEAGADLRCHADFDWAGLRIVDQLVRQFGATPWRMQPEDYLKHHGAVSLAPQPFHCEWSEKLAEKLREREKAVFEEQTIRELIGDLAAG